MIKFECWTCEDKRGVWEAENRDNGNDLCPACGTVGMIVECDHDETEDSYMWYGHCFQEQPDEVYSGTYRVHCEERLDD